MKKIRQLIQKGDPKLNVLIPKQIITSIKEAAQVGKRHPKDEIIKRLAATIKAEGTYKILKDVVINQIK